MQTTADNFTTFTPLGIRLWDPVLDQQIIDDLIVTAHPSHIPDNKAMAYRTRSDVYSFSHLEGMRGIEYGYENYDETASPDKRHNFIVEIRDKHKRYIDVAFPVDLPLPYSGVFLSSGPESSPHVMPKGVYLYSSPTRAIPGWNALVRGEILDQGSNKPAAHALLRVGTDDGEYWYGIADDKGRFSVMFPYPVLQDGFGASPITPDHKPLHLQTWDLQLEVFYSPNTLENLSGTFLPDYLSILKQEAAQIWPQPESEGGTPVVALPILLEYQKSTIARTDGLTQLLVSPLQASP